MDTLALVNSACRPVEALLAAGQTEEALSLLNEITRNDPANRELQLYSLLVKITASGLEPHEVEVNGICLSEHLTETERAIVAAIFRRGYDAAVNSDDYGKAAAYGRALRRLVAGLSLDGPIVVTPPSVREPAVLDGSFSWAPAKAGGRLPQDMLRHCRTGFSAAIRAIELEKIGHGFGAWRHCAVVFSPQLKRLKALLNSRVPAHYVILAFLIGFFIWLPAIFREERSARLETVTPGQPQMQPMSEDSIRPFVPLRHEPSDAGPASENAGTHLRDRPKRASVGSDEVRKANRDDSETRPSDSEPARAHRLDKTTLNETAMPVMLKALQTIGLRDEPRYGAPTGEPLQPGASLLILEANGSWLRVRSEATGEIGYVRREFLSAASPAGGINPHRDSNSTFDSFPSGHPTNASASK